MWMMKMNNNNKSYKLISKLLVISIFISWNIAYPNVSFAAQPIVSVDESAYVNLDYYGSVTGINIVKGCSLNGNTSFTDYGDYSNVENMSTYDKPISTTGKLNWNLSGDKDKRFYFNCQIDPAKIQLPWTFDLTYKLNGVPKKAEEMAGASGLVEIVIKVKPNAKARDYYKNNMLLQIATVVNTDDTYSLDAPGSQLQTIGSHKTVLFMCLPGEENTFSIRMGTDNFETTGITMMMIPGTLTQFEDIKALKESKDTIQASSDAVYAAMDSLLNNLGSMNNGLSTLKSGAAEFDQGRKILSDGKDQLNTLSDTAISDLVNVNTQLNELIPYFQTVKNLTNDLKNNVDDMVDTLQKLDSPLSESASSISSMQTDLNAMSNMLDTLSAQLGAMLTNLGAVVKGEQADPYQSAEFQGTANMAGTLGVYKGNIKSLLSESVDVGSSIKDIISISQKLINETDDLNSTLGDYHNDMISLLDDSETMTTLASKSLGSTTAFLSYTNFLLQNSGDNLDSGSEKALAGMLDLLDKSLLSLKDVKLLKNANSVIKVTIDNQFDKFEKENKFLFMDPNAPLMSFTSDKNPSPASIQIILRTAEINKDQIDKNIIDLEKNKPDVGIFGRISNLFKKIIDSIMSLF
ncbi:MAG: hypothetical protein WCF96_02415 [Eubacteriales bacterium]